MTTSSSADSASSALHCHGVVRLAGLGGLLQSVGPETIDLYLQEFEARLRQVIRPSDKLLKISTDKYCLVLRDVVDRSLVDLAVAKLGRELEMPADIVGDQFYYEINAGFALPDGNVESNKALLQAAENALGLAISTSQAAVVVVPGELQASRADPSLLPRLKAALERGEFVLYYQAKFDAAYRTVVGAEGLVRWHDSATKTVVMPGEFIEVAEQSDLIKPLTETLLKSGIARCATWADPLTVAINVPPSILETPDVVTVVSDALDFYGLAPARLILEITERGELPPNALMRLAALREVGVRVSIDDFGTGQCSLSYFRDLPADQVKIDQSFVQAMLTSHKDRSIVLGCIDLAHHCNMQVVAEGVEDEETAKELTSMGCDLLQGYWFGRPLQSEEFERVHLPGQNGLNTEDDHFSRLLR